MYLSECMLTDTCLFLFCCMMHLATVVSSLGIINCYHVVAAGGGGGDFCVSS
jgi:hypothetical protein